MAKKHKRTKSMHTQPKQESCKMPCKGCNFLQWLLPLVILVFVWTPSLANWAKWGITISAAILLLGRLFCKCSKCK